MVITAKTKQGGHSFENPILINRQSQANHHYLITVKGLSISFLVKAYTEDKILDILIQHPYGKLLHDNSHEAQNAQLHLFGSPQTTIEMQSAEVEVDYGDYLIDAQNADLMMKWIWKKWDTPEGIEQMKAFVRSDETNLLEFFNDDWCSYVAAENESKSDDEYNTSIWPIKRIS